MVKTSQNSSVDTSVVIRIACLGTAYKPNQQVSEKLTSDFLKDVYLVVCSLTNQIGVEEDYKPVAVASVR